jgi:hypothetical protein
MGGIKQYFADDLIGTGLSLRTHLDEDGDLWIAILEQGGVMESVLLSKEVAGELAEVLATYAAS